MVPFHLIYCHFDFTLKLLIIIAFWTKFHLFNIAKSNNPAGIFNINIILVQLFKLKNSADLQEMFSHLLHLQLHYILTKHRCMTILVEKSVPFDLRMLRSFRCLRPLKMVSKVPSKLVYARQRDELCCLAFLIHLLPSASSFGVYYYISIRVIFDDSQTSYSKTHFLTVIVFTT